MEQVVSLESSELRNYVHNLVLQDDPIVFFYPSLGSNKYNLK